MTKRFIASGTSIDDIAKWVGNLGHPVVGDVALIQQMMTRGTRADGKPVNYGFGLWRLRFAGHNAVMHRGSDAGYHTILSDELDFAYRFTAEDGHVVARSIWTTTPLVLVPTIADSFDGDYGSIIFQRNATGRPTGLILNMEAARSIKFDRVE